ncbi:methyltransferase domain-containing protein [Patescibacteria group bacterium]|nr:methyltransferase domain-containing protein [Patescibacteria group bacterium]
MAFIDPKNNIAQFGLNQGMKVADLGSGSGFYVMESSKAVGNDGRVYAVDVQKELLERIKASASLEGLSNIEIIWGDIEKLGGTRLADFSVDAVILSNTLFQVEEKENLINEMKRILRPKGRALIVDWTASFGGLGPAPESVFTEHQAKDLFQKNGFVLDKDISAGEHHYGFVVRKNN